MGLKHPRYYRIRDMYIAQEKREREAEMPRTQTPEEWIEETNAEVMAFTQRETIDALKVYHDFQQEERRAKDGKEAAGRLIRQYLELNDESEIEDAERGLRAILASRRSGKESYDVRSMPWQLVKKLHAAGCLSMDVDMLNQKANAALRMECQGQLIPAGETTYLRVVKE